MPDFTFPELNSDQGTQTADTLRNVANAAANAVCDLYEDYPSGIIPSFGDPTGVGAFTDGLLNRLCSPRGKVPTPPTVPFSGGQCVCVQYRVQGTYNGFGIGSGNFDLFAFGPIGAIFNNKLPGGDNRYGFLSGTDACGGRVFNGVIQSGLDGTVTITSVTRQDSQPDTCGDPPPQYPIVVIPPEAFSPTIAVNFPGVTVNAPVTVIPTVFAPLTVFRPELNVKVGPINVNFNLGGVDFDVNLPSGDSVVLPPGDTRPTPPTPVPPKNQPSQPCDLTEVNRKLDEIRECACKEEKTLKSVAYGLARGRSIALPSDTQYVLVITDSTSGVKFQVSEGNAPDVYYLGWYSFGRGANAGEKVALNFEACGILCPEGATNFSYSLNFGSVASLTVYYLEEN